MGCSAAGQPERPDIQAPDYEIVSEQDGEGSSSLDVKDVKVTTDTIKEEDLRLIARDIKYDNLDRDALDIEFYPDGWKQGGGEDTSEMTGAAMVANSDEAADEFFSGPLFEGVDTDKLLNEDDGVAVIPFAEIEQEMDQQVEEDMQQMEEDIQQAEEDMDREMRKMEREMDKGMRNRP